MIRPVLAGVLLPITNALAAAQYPPGEQGSSNVHIVSHIPLGRALTISDVEIEQELSRPYAYVSRMHSDRKSAGFDIISLKDPSRARVIYSWKIAEPELHLGLGGLGPAYLKSRGRYYYVQSFQFAQGGPDVDLAALVFDVTGLPDTSQIRLVTRVRAADAPGGFHEIFAYKHSDGRALLFTTSTGPAARIYDIEQVVAQAADEGLVGRIPVPGTPATSEFLRRALPGYHDFYVGYEPGSRQDRFYGAGQGGFYVYDVTNVQQPRLLTSVTGMVGVDFGHTFTPDPTGRYAVIETEYQFAPLRIVDLKPGLDGTVKTVSRPIGAWTATWQNLAHNHEVRWPYVFVSGYEDGLHVFNMMDPANPYTVGYYDTYEGPHNEGYLAGATPLGDIFNGSFGVDVRNADGLIVTSDMTSGFWALKLDGFDGWNGHQWGVPNVSSAQDWDNGPDGAPRSGKVS
jgi:hypothetical protein